GTSRVEMHAVFVEEKRKWRIGAPDRADEAVLGTDEPEAVSCGSGSGAISRCLLPPAKDRLGAGLGGRIATEDDRRDGEARDFPAPDRVMNRLCHDLYAEQSSPFGLRSGAGTPDDGVRQERAGYESELRQLRH